MRMKTKLSLLVLLIAALAATGLSFWVVGDHTQPATRMGSAGAPSPEGNAPTSPPASTVTAPLASPVPTASSQAGPTTSPPASTATASPASPALTAPSPAGPSTSPPGSTAIASPTSPALTAPSPAGPPSTSPSASTATGSPASPAPTAPGPAGRSTSSPAPTATAPSAAAVAMPNQASMTEADRRLVQDRLHSQGYYRGPVDGIFGPMTATAIRLYQHEIGSEVTGRLTSEEANRLVRAH
jgi:cytoskeletal protein RodZ